MPCQLLDGKAIALQVQQQVQQHTLQRKQQGLATPGLAVILVGDNPASAVYVKHKQRACRSVGIDSTLYHLAENASLSEVEQTIAQCNQDPKTHAILLQLPLPAHLDTDLLLEKIHPQKDVDGFHPYNLGRLAQQRPALRCCTPKGVMALLAHSKQDLSGKHAVIVGASNIVGRPMALELLQAQCTISICHRFTTDLQQHIQQADILIAAIGQPGVIQTSWIKPGAIVIDVGFTRGDDGKIYGDIDQQGVPQASWLTPVPGGVGPMTVCSLLDNTLIAAKLLEHAAEKE